MTDIDTILAKCEKLQAHAESARAFGSLAEAEAFTTKLFELLERHQLGLDDVAKREREEEVDLEVRQEWTNYAAMAGLSGRQRVSWVERLLSRLALAHRCRILVLAGSGSICVIGTEDDRKAVKYLASTLLPRLRATAAAEYRKAKAEALYGLPHGWTTSWLCGAAEGIYEQLRVKQEELREQATSTALIRVDQRKEAVAKYMAGLKTTTASGLSSGRSSNAYSKGRAHGRSMNITRGVGGGSSAGQLNA